MEIESATMGLGLEEQPTLFQCLKVRCNALRDMGSSILL